MLWSNVKDRNSSAGRRRRELFSVKKTKKGQREGHSFTGGWRLCEEAASDDRQLQQEGWEE